MNPLNEAGSYVNIACVLAEIGDQAGARDALATASAIQLGDYGATCFIQIAAVQTELRDASGVQVTLKRAEEAISQALDENWKQSRYSEIASVRGRSGDAAGAIAAISATIHDKAAQCRALANAAEKLFSPWAGPERSAGVDGLWADANSSAK